MVQPDMTNRTPLHPPKPASRRRCLATLGGASLLPWLGGCMSVRAESPAPTLATTDPRTPPLVLPEPANPALPSLVLIGDSTVRNGRDDGQGLGALGQWGWGHVLARELDAARVNLVNRAIGGLSSRTYRTGGHWQRTQGFVRRGDVVLMQFGHNDASPVNDRQRARGTLRGTGSETEQIHNLLTGQPETVATYGAYLRSYVQEIRESGATPVICSPVPRRRFDAQGRTLRGIHSHAGWAQAVAREMNVAFIDLDADVSERYDELGPAVVEQLFPRSQPEERVHTNWAGAVLNAKAVLQGLRKQALLPEQAFLPPGLATAPAVLRPAAPLDPRRPTLFTIGDSTVRSAGQNGHWGWGERLGDWLVPNGLQLANLAMAGRSTRSFLREGRWDAVRALLKPGDTVLIQFGHNDGARVGDPAGKQRGSLPGTGPETTQETLPDGTRETVGTFGAHLRRMVREALAAGALPVVMSPVPHKDRWQHARDFENFAAWGREVAAAEGAPFIDLTLIVTEAYRALGAAVVDTLFADARTHTNDAGARLNARCVARGLRQLPQAWLATYLQPEG
jgi:lysophospholipase L1-like esterase